MANASSSDNATPRSERGDANLTSNPSENPLRTPGNDQPAARWTFLTNHAHVLILLSRNPSMVLREVALLVGITERAVQRIISDLESEQFIQREKVGRQNRYRILRELHLRHPVEAHRTIGELLHLIDHPDTGSP